MTYTIESAAPGDLPAVQALLAEAGLPLEGLSSDRLLLLVARASGKIVGCAGMETYPDGVLLRSVAVAPEIQGSGLGRALTEAALRQADSAGVSSTYLLTTTAPAFFSRFGFVETTHEAVPDGVRSSVEFTSACPASAQVLARRSHQPESK